MSEDYLPEPDSILEEETFTAPNGNTFRIIRTNELDPYEKPKPAVAMEMSTAAAAAAGDDFNGSSRRTAKLSIGTGKLTTFADLNAILDTLPSDDAMTHHHPPIEDTPESGRVAEEQRNVRTSAFLYAASRESDNDFHLILGPDPSTAQKRFMTAELSGLPPKSAASFHSLKSSRDAFKAHFGNRLPGSTYDVYASPQPVKIAGSLFFDVHHAGPVPKPGPEKLKPQTIWEIHPITEIEFLSAAHAMEIIHTDEKDEG
jgi:hypothetical protein